MMHLKIFRKKLLIIKDVIFSSKCLKKEENGSMNKRFLTKESHLTISKTFTIDLMLPLQLMEMVMKTRMMQEVARRVKKRPKRKKERERKAKEEKMVARKKLK